MYAKQLCDKKFGPKTEGILARVGIDEFDTLFTAVKGNCKIYKHREDMHERQKLLLSRVLSPRTPLPTQISQLVERGATPEMKPPLHDLMERALLRQIAPASVLVNAKGEVLFVHGHTGNFLETSPGRPGVSNVLQMARKDLRPTLSTMLRHAVATQKICAATHVKVTIKGEPLWVKVGILPVNGDDTAVPGVPLFAVTFADVPKDPAVLRQDHDGTEVYDSGAAAHIIALTQELHAKEEYLQSTIETLAHYSEDLQSTTEEMQSSNEELQSVNEALVAINTELQSKVLDLSRANNDINNLLGGTGIGTLFVDRQLHILSFTPAVRDIFDLHDTDVGRPVTNFVAKLQDYNCLGLDIQNVLNSLTQKMQQVKSTAGRWFVMRILPYRTMDNMVEGVVISFVDNTEMVLTQQALKHSNELLERTGALAKIGGWEVDLQTMKLSWTPELFKTAELEPPVEPPLEQCINLYAPEARTTISAALQAAIDSGTPYDLELPIISAKGRAGWVRTLGYAEMREGKPVRLYGTFQDITARKAAEAAFQEIEDRYKTLVEHAPMCIHELDLEGKLISMNHSGLSMMGLTDQCQIQGQDYLTAVSDEDKARISIHLDQACSGKSSSFEFKSSGPVEQYYQSCLVPLKNGNGDVVRVMGMTDDITIRRKTHMKLIETFGAKVALSERLALATRAGKIGIWEYDVVNNQIVWDDAMFALYGTSADKFGGAYEAWREGVHPEDQGRGDAEIQAALRGDQDFDTEFRVQWPNGEVRSIRAIAIVQRDSSGRALRMVGTNWDISAQKAIEAALQNALKEKTSLLMEVHHRVKNNLQIIASLLRLESRRNTQPEAVDVLKAMQGRIYAMAQLHQSLYRSGTFASVDLGAYVRQIASQAFEAGLLSVRVVKIALNVGSVSVGMDQAIACGLMVNELVSNCLKHGFPHGRSGEVYVELQPADSATVQTDGVWCLRVRDNGVGLPPDFDSRRKGSLGLQLVEDLSSQAGGTLAIQSQPDAGTEFSVIFKALAPERLVMPL